MSKKAMDNVPLVTVIALCYNHAQYIVECLEGIRNQTYKSIELIIMDDCSADDSVDVINHWIAEHRVDCRFIAHKENLGICKTLNEALSHAKGEFISITSTDDVWLENKIDTQLKVFLDNPKKNIGVVYGNAYLIDKNGQKLKDQSDNERLFIQYVRPMPTMPQGHIFLTLLEANFIPAPSVLIKRSCYDKVGTYDESLCYEDYDMWLRIAQHYEFVYCPTILTQYRILPNSLGTRMGKELHRQRYESEFRIFTKYLKDQSLSKIDLYRLKTMISLAACNMHIYGSQIKDRLSFAMWHNLFMLRLFKLFNLSQRVQKALFHKSTSLLLRYIKLHKRIMSFF